MKFSITSIVGFAALFVQSLAVNVACLAGGVQVAVVDLDTGICPFPIPANDPAFFNFISREDYNIEFYYTIVRNIRYFTDIVHAGRIVNVPARFLFGTPGSDLFQVHLEEQPASNSTAAIRKRLFKDAPIAKRDEADDFAEEIQNTEGALLVSDYFQVVPIAESSTTSGSPTGTESTTTETEVSTTVVTVTSCSAGTCTTATVPATPSVVTTTVHGVTTVYTTFCPLTTVTEESTTVITITSCSENICVPTTVPAKETVVTTTVNEVVTVYTTFCPLSSVETVESTKTITITSCSNNACSTATVPATPQLTTETIEGTVTEFITYCPLTTGGVPEATTPGQGPQGEATTTLTSIVGTATVTSRGPVSPPYGSTTSSPAVGQTTSVVAPAGQSAAPGVISTFEAGAATVGATFLALALVPLAYFI